MPHTLNSHNPPQQLSEEDVAPTAYSQSNSTSSNSEPIPSDDWADVTQELLDSLPRRWTRGLLYFLVVFVAIVLPWAMFNKVDETGTAKGRLELKGDTVKKEADIPGAVAVVAVRVKEGDEVKAGQILMELDSKSIRDEVQQNQIKLSGQQNRLNQLEVLKNQWAIAIGAQQQQNKAEELKQLALVNQARQNLESSLEGVNSQKEEKLALVAQMRQNLFQSQTDKKFADSRYAKAEKKVQGYKSLFEKGAISEERFNEVKQADDDSLQAREKASSEIKQAKQRLEEQQASYQSFINQASSNIEQAKLRLEEQQRGYQSIIQAGKLATAKNEQQLSDLKTQITGLQSEIAQTQTQIKSLNEQLEKYLIRAPFDGKIFQLPIKREGAVVQPKQLIAEIAQAGTRLVFRGQIPTSESESLREGHKRKDVNLKFDEYPFQDYEVVKGKLSWVSPDSRITQTSQGNIATYDLEVELAQFCIQPKSKCLPFKSGQPATAEIIIRQRRIIDFILDPFKKLQKGELKL